MAKRIHTIVTDTAPDLTPRTWYGMPAYANKDGKVVCFFQDAQKFKARYATVRLQRCGEARARTPCGRPSFALKKVTAAEEKKIAALVKKAVELSTSSRQWKRRSLFSLDPTVALARLEHGLPRRRRALFDRTVAKAEAEPWQGQVTDSPST